MGSPSNRGLQACAGGVTGAVPHMVKKNNGSISSLFIILLHHNHWCNDSMKLTKVFLTILCILAFFLFSHLARSDRISLCSISRYLQKSTVSLSSIRCSKQSIPLSPIVWSIIPKPISDISCICETPFMFP